ncbi:glycosyltransferase [Szabonella alba]|nr:glycosyltransferase [Szabonella alba]
MTGTDATATGETARRLRRMPVPPAHGFGVSLLKQGLVSAQTLVLALTLQRRHGGRLADILLAQGLIAPDLLHMAMSRYWSLPLIDADRHPPDPGLVERLGPVDCLREGLLPIRSNGQVTLVATARPEDFARHHPWLTARLGPVMAALMPADQIETALRVGFGARLARRAEERVPAAESCRNWRSGPMALRAGLVLAVLAMAVWLAPLSLGLALVIWASVTLLLTTLLRLAALIAALRPAPSAPPPVPILRLPMVSVMVALHREDDIAPRLIRRLERIDYPRDLLDVLLVVEEKDSATRAALAGSGLPQWMRVVVVPDGVLKTKPRALNYALDLCRGSIIGVYDAEDAPEPAQIHKVVTRFHQRGPEVACLQGVLDFYNSRTNWLSRCFTLEYATWFRIILPGLARLGLVIPLGGTTLFFRRAALEGLGGWDAHNVTEDADLGVRLARHGYRTELLDTVTGEEANCRTLPWIRQRSRWLKGYMVTWMVHMRDPALLWRQLGAWRFAGFQILFLCTLSQFLLAPLLWSFWIIAFGMDHPLANIMPGGSMGWLLLFFLATEVIGMLVNLEGLRRIGYRISPFWVPSLHFYFPLAALASYKALWELVLRPFYWDKTSHGHFDPK